MQKESLKSKTVSRQKPKAESAPKTEVELSAAKLAKERKSYRERKKQIMEKEKTNYSKVVVFRSVKGYWVAVDHSAIILAFVLAKPAKLRARLIRDNDFSVKSKLGMVSIRNLEKYKEALVNTGLCKIIYNKDDYLIFELKKPLTETEFDLFAKDEENKREYLRNEVLKICPMSTSLCRVRELTLAFFRYYKKKAPEKEAQKYIGNVFNDIYYAYYTLIKTCRRGDGLETGIEAVLKKLDDALIEIMILTDIDAMTAEKATVFSSRLNDARFTIIKEYKKITGRKDPRSDDKN